MLINLGPVVKNSAEVMPDGERVSFHVEVSALPDAPWTAAFEKHAKPRGLVASASNQRGDGKLVFVVHCARSQIQVAHETLKAVVGATNATFAVEEQQKSARRLAAEAREAEVLREANDVLDKL